MKEPQEQGKEYSQKLQNLINRFLTEIEEQSNQYNPSNGAKYDDIIKNSMLTVANEIMKDNLSLKDSFHPGVMLLFKRSDLGLDNPASRIYHELMNISSEAGISASSEIVQKHQYDIKETGFAINSMVTRLRTDVPNCNIRNNKTYALKVFSHLYKMHLAKEPMTNKERYVYTTVLGALTNTNLGQFLRKIERTNENYPSAASKYEESKFNLIGYHCPRFHEIFTKFFRSEETSETSESSIGDFFSSLIDFCLVD